MAERAGQPTKYNAEFHPADFLKRSEAGESIAQIAGAWKVARATMYNWAEENQEFLDAMKIGSELVERWYAQLGQQAMVGQAKINGQKIENFSWQGFKWMSQNVCKWRQNVNHELAGPGGKPIEYQNLTEEELRARAAKITEQITRDTSGAVEESGEDSK